MVQKMSLRMKLFVLITLIVAFTFSLISLIVSSRSIKISTEDAFLLADEMSAKYSYEIKSELQAARVSSESLMIVFKTLIERGEADRDTLNAILRNSLMQKQYITSFWCARQGAGTWRCKSSTGPSRGTVSRTARVSTARWNLKEAAGKALA